jgi:hypothetical protein
LRLNKLYNPLVESDAREIRKILVTVLREQCSPRVPEIISVTELKKMLVRFFLS